MKKLIATLVLGLYLIRHFILLVLNRFKTDKETGYRKFMDNFKQDDIVPITKEEAQIFSEMHKCIRCGICDSLCENGVELMSLSFTPSQIASTLSRSLPELKFNSESITKLNECGDCTECYELCPTGIDIKMIANQIRRIGNNI